MQKETVQKGTEQKDTAQKMVAEIIGTFALLFVGMLAIVHNPGLLGVALAHGLAIGVMVMALGVISGGQFNPAVSIALSLTGKQSWSDTALCILAQLIGAALGAFAALALVGQTALSQVAFAQPAVGSAFTVPGALLAEVITTFFLVLVILQVAVRQSSAVAGLTIGLTIAVDILAVGPISGAAMNPARAFGPAVISGAWSQLWIYLVGPLLGAGLAALVARLFWQEQRQSALQQPA